MHLLRCFSILKLHHFSVLIFLLMVLDLTSSLPILMWSSTVLAVQLDVYRLCLATRGLWGILPMFIINTWWEGAEKMKPDHAQWCPVKGQEPAAQIETYEKKFCTVRMVKHWTSCPERLWSLQPCRNTSTDWIQAWATCSGHMALLDQRVGSDNLQKHLPPPATLWSCGSAQLHPTIHKLITPCSSAKQPAITIYPVHEWLFS